MFLNIAWLSYLIFCEPYLENQENQIEKFNASLFLVFTYLVPAFPFIAPNASVVYLGNLSIIVIGLMITVNVVWTISQIIKDKKKKKVWQKNLDDKKKAHERETM